MCPMTKEKDVPLISDEKEVCGMHLCVTRISPSLRHHWCRTLRMFRIKFAEAGPFPLFRENIFPCMLVLLHATPWTYAVGHHQRQETELHRPFMQSWTDALMPMA